MKIILLLLASVSGALAASPILLYSDLTDGPRTGGENGKGAYVCVYGRNFGATRGSSTVTVGGTAVDNYPVWGSGNAVARGDDKACFQLGTSVPTGAQTIQMTVGGQTSNTLPFYVRAGGFSPTVADGLDGIYCVSNTAMPVGGTAPSDSNDGHFGTTAGHGCWATIANMRTALFSTHSAIVYLAGVSITGVAGDNSLQLYGTDMNGVANANFFIAGYPGGSPATIGTNDRSTQTWGVKIANNYFGMSNLLLRGYTNAFRSFPDNGTYSHHWRIVGMDITCESTSGQSACANINNGRTFQWYGNLMHDVALTEPHGYMPTAIPSSPYDSSDSVISSLVSTGSLCTVNTVNSPGDIFVGDGTFATSPGIQFMNAPSGIGADQMIGNVSAVGAHSFSFPCTVAAGTYDQTTNPFMWYSGRTKYQHTLYLGSMVTDWDAGWNEFKNNWTNQDIFSHSTQQAIINPRNASAKGFWGVPQPLTPSMPAEFGWPSLSTTSGCTSGTCTGNGGTHTYYVAFSWQGNGGETDGSHETTYTIADGQRLVLTAPPLVTNYPKDTGFMFTPDFLEGGECFPYTDCQPTGWCVYVGTAAGHSKQQSCSTTSGGTWTEPVGGISLAGSERLDITTQTAAYMGGYTGTHIFVHDNLIHGGASDGMRIDAADPIPVGTNGDTDTAGGVYVYNNVIYKQAKPYEREANSGPLPQPTEIIGPYYKDNAWGSGVCISIGPSAHNGPIPQGTVKVENNTCYDINGYWTDGVTFVGMIMHNRYFWDPYDLGGNDSCQTIVEANNNLFVSTTSAATTPWISAITYSNTACANSLKGRKNVWWSTIDSSRVPPDASALNGDSSCVFGGIGTGKACFTQNISSDPKFTNPTAGDFTLQASSPVISAGIDTTPTTDYYGNVRPSGSYSLGAIQFNNGCTVSLSPATPGPYTVGQTISTITATATNCGAGTLTWTSSGLPTGVSGCNSVTGTTCTMTGTVTTAGTFSSANVSVTDGGANSASKTVSITVNAAPSITSSGSLATGVQGVAYSQALATTGGTSPFTCAVVTGALPPGLSFSGCTIQGTPSGSTGTATFTAHATDANGITGATSASLSITINAAPTPPTVTTSSLPGGVIGVAYSATLAATGDTPITWSVVVGSLPAWASLNSSTGAITGTPNAAATTAFTVRATNAAGHDDKALSITVTAIPPLTRTQGLTFKGLPVIR